MSNTRQGRGMGGTSPGRNLFAGPRCLGIAKPRPSNVRGPWPHWSPSLPIFSFHFSEPVIAGRSFPMKTQKQNPNQVTKSQLSRLAGVSRTTVSRYLLSGDAPPGRRGLYDKAEALQFLRSHVATAGRSPELERLRIRKLELEIAKVEHELGVAKGEYIKLSTVWPQVQRTILELNADLYRRFEHELPPRLVGKRLIEISLTCRDALDASFAAFKAGGKRIEQAATPTATQAGKGATA